MHSNIITTFRRFVVGSLDKICFIGALFALLAVTVGGGLAGGALGLFFGAIVGILFISIFFGPIFLLIENNRNIAEIRDAILNNQPNKNR